MQQQQPFTCMCRCSFETHVNSCHTCCSCCADWIDLKLKASDVPFGKNTKTVELAAGKVLMLYKFENMVRCLADSPACSEWLICCCLMLLIFF
jgi:hypothetical protein